MLVLARKVDQRIVLDEGRIVITVAEIRGDKVRLGIQAPSDCSIHREEIWIEIQKERAAQKS